MRLRTLWLLLALVFVARPAYAQQTYIAYSGAGAPTGWCVAGSDYVDINSSAHYGCSNGAWTLMTPTASAGLPSGMIAFIDSGTCPSGFTELAGLDGKVLRGTVAAHADVGGTGGSDTVTPTGTNGALTFTGSSVSTSSDSAGTPAGTNGTGTVTATGTIAWPAGVPTFSGNSVALASGVAAAQIFTGTPFSSVINHTHTITVTNAVQGGTTAATTGTHIMTSTATGGSARAVTAGDSFTATSANPGGGVSSITPAGTNGTSTVTGTTTATGTVAWPAGVPTFTGSSATTSAETFTGSALGTHSHTLTAAGTINTPSFTGNSHSTLPAYEKLIACKAN